MHCVVHCIRAQERDKAPYRDKRGAFTTFDFDAACVRLELPPKADVSGEEVIELHRRRSSKLIFFATGNAFVGQNGAPLSPKQHKAASARFDRKLRKQERTLDSYPKV